MAHTDRCDAFPWRGLLLGALLIPPTTLFGVYAYIVAQACLWTQTSLLRGPVFVLFWLVVLNLGLRRLRSRLALAEHDLLLIYVMQCVATAVGGIGWCQFIVPTLGSASYYATPENGYAAFQEYLPRAWCISAPQVVQNLYRGHSSLYQALNWQAVLRPFCVWSAFMVLLAGLGLCVGQLLREQWVSRERLTFPLTYLPLEVSRDGGAPAVWGNRLLWLGFGLAAFVDCVNGLHYHIPAVPEILVKPADALRIDQSWTTRPLSALRPFVLSFYPFMIGIGFLLTLDVAFSCWAWYLLIKLFGLVSVNLGWSDSPLRSGAFPYLPEQGVGAFAALAGIALWRSRHELSAIVRRGASLNQTAVLGALACLGLLLVFWARFGLPAWVGAGWLLVYVVYAVGCSRIVSETGSGWVLSPRLTPYQVVLQSSLSSRLNPRASTVAAWLMPFDLDFRDAAMPQYLQAMRLLPDDGGRRRPLQAALVLATVIGIVAGLWAHLHVYFQYGVDSALTRRWPAQVGRQPFDLLANLLKGNPPQPYGLAGVACGGALLTALVVARSRILAWPLHPIGYALGTTVSMDYMWTPFLIAWLAKVVVLRMGGMAAYRQALPFFLGLILGDYVVPLGWALYGTISGTQQYLSFPH